MEDLHILLLSLGVPILVLPVLVRVITGSWSLPPARKPPRPMFPSVVRLSQRLRNEWPDEWLIVRDMRGDQALKHLAARFDVSVPDDATIEAAAVMILNALDARRPFGDLSTDGI